MLSRTTFFSFLLIFVITGLSAQKSNEIGGYLGFASYQGDFTQSTLELEDTKFVLGVLARHQFNPKLMLRGNLLFARIAGDDGNAENNRIREARNWNFKSTLIEISSGLEWMPFRRANYGDTGVFESQINPYLFLGIGYTLSQSNLETGQSTEISLEDTGGSNNLLVVPFGAGIRYDIQEKLAISGEVVWRYTGSDYVDGISAGKQVNSDWYFFSGVSITYTLGEQVLSE